MSEKQTLGFIEKHFKEIKIVNILLILTAIGLNIYSFFDIPNIYWATKISFATTVTSLIFGLVYVYKGYRKEDVKTFNLFINLCILTLILQIPAEIFYISTGDNTVQDAIISVFSLVLEITILIMIELIKDLGSKSSLTLACTILGFAIFNLIRTIALYGDTSYVPLAYSGVVLACILCLFVVAKYRDKSIRGVE